LFKFGYRPELRKRLEEEVQKELSRLVAEKEAKKQGNGNKKQL
jgi:hypothetical protein